MSIQWETVDCCCSIVMLHMSCGVIFKMFGTHWVLPSTVAYLFLGKELIWKHSSDGWNLTPLCLMWIACKEHHSRTFEDSHWNPCCWTLFDWSYTWGFTHCTSIVEFQDSLDFSVWFFVIFIDILCVYHCEHELIFYFNIYFYLSKKESIMCQTNQN